MKPDLKEGLDFYWEESKIVFTEKYHLDRKWCCGSKCRHCPYDPKYIKFSTEIKKELKS